MTSRWIRVGAAVGLVVGLALGWLTVRGLAWDQVGGALRVTSVPLLALALAIFLLALYIRAARWRLLFVQERVSVVRLLLIENAASGLNSVSPVRVLSEPTQLAILTLRDRLPLESVVATMVAIRVMDKLVNIAMVGAGLMVFPFTRPFAPYVALGALISTAGIVIFALAGTGARNIPPLSRLPFAVSLGDAVAAMRAAPARVLLSLVLSFAYWTATGLSAWVAARAMGLGPGPFFAIVLVQAVILFSTSVPGLPGAFGNLEFAVVVLLGAWGVPREAAFSYAVVLHLLLFLPPVLMTVVVLPREGVRSLAAWRALTGEWRAREAQKPLEEEEG